MPSTNLVRCHLPRGGTEPILTLAQVLGPSGDEAIKRIAASGQLVFHAVGDTGSTRGPHNQSLVSDKMMADFDEEAAENVPLRIEFHPASDSDAAKTPDDVVAVDLATRKLAAPEV
jgi:hypothetical protein